MILQSNSKKHHFHEHNLNATRRFVCWNHDSRTLGRYWTNDNREHRSRPLLFALPTDYFVLVSYLVYSWTLKMEAMFARNVGFHQTIPEDRSHHHSTRGENLKCYNDNLTLTTKVATKCRPLWLCNYISSNITTRFKRELLQCKGNLSKSHHVYVCKGVWRWESHFNSSSCTAITWMSSTEWRKRRFVCARITEQTRLVLLGTDPGDFFGITQ